MNVIISIICWLSAILYTAFDVHVHPAINGIVITVLLVSGMFYYSASEQESVEAKNTK
jgi:hypothetical protein